MSHHRFTIGVLVLGNLLLGLSALAQIPPADMVNGVFLGSGTSVATLTTVPAGQTLVLTDLSWGVEFPSSQGHSRYQLQLVGTISPTSQWFLWGYLNGSSGTGYQTLPVSEHWTTGLPYDSGEQVRFSVGWPPATNWVVSWAGYLVPGSASSVDEQSPPATKSSRLEQNIPNPFNPATEIRYLLEADGEVEIAIYDNQGRRVRALDRGMKEAGEHVIQWDGRNDNREAVASGVYYYELETARGRQARKAVLLK